MHILLINSDSEHVRSVQQQLTRALPGHHLVVVEEAADLVSQMENAQFDAILLDLTGGEDDGASWIAQLQRLLPQVPVLALVREDSLPPVDVESLTVVPGWIAHLIERLNSWAPGASGGLEEEYRRLQKNAHMWAALSQIGRTLSSTLEPDKVLDLILEQAVQVLGAEGGSLLLVDQQTKELVFELVLGPTADELIGMRLAMGVGLVGEAAATGQPVLVNNTADDPRWFSGYDETTDFTTQSILCAPMIARQEVIGVLEVVNKRDGSLYGEDEADLLLALASQAAIAITNARLYVAARRQAEEVAALLETSQAISSAPDLAQRLYTISHKAQELVDADACVIYLLDEENQFLQPIIALGDSAQEVMAVSMKLGEGVSGGVALAGEGRIVNHVHLHSDGVWIPNTPRVPESLLSVPLLVKGATIGVMTLSRLGEREFVSHDLDLILSLGNQAAVAIENARLYDDTRQRNKELTALYSIAMAAGKTLEMIPLLEETLQQVLEVLEHEGGGIYLVQEKPDQLELMHHRGISEQVFGHVSDQLKSAGAIDQAAATGKIIDQLLSVSDAGLEIRLICAPLIARQRVLGVLVILSQGGRPIESQEVRLLETLGRQVGVAIENAVLYAELQDRAETLQRAYDELAKVDQLKDELVQNISHELRTPITFIKGYVSLMMEGDLGELSSAQIRSLEIVSNKTDQLIHLVNGILTLQTLTSEALKVESISAIALAARAIEGARLAAEEAGISLVADHPTELPHVMADVSRITQVFDNLLDNAIKFSPHGGTITVKLREGDQMVHFEVSDTGIGIPKDRIDQVFDRFYQVDGSSTRRFGGAGLGLAICKQIIEVHGGKIKVESEEEMGSIFVFTIPQAQSK